MNIKTEFWNENSLEIWRYRYSKIAWSIGFFTLANIIAFIYYKNYILTAINVFLFIILSIIIISQTKWENQRK